MIHVYVRRFVVMGTVGIFWELNMASDSMFQEGSQRSSGVMLWGALGGLGQGCCVLPMEGHGLASYRQWW